MRLAAILFCIMPWVVGLIATLLTNVQTALAVFSPEWMLISPLFTALALLVAYREGQRSVHLAIKS